MKTGCALCFQTEILSVRYYIGLFVLVLKVLRRPLWSSGQSSWLQIQRSGFDSWRYQIFLQVVGLERGPLSLVSAFQEVLERKSSGSGLEIWEYGRRIRHADHVVPSMRKFGTNFADKWQSIGPYSSLTDSGYRVKYSIPSPYHSG
jgi:hypothetical protein